MAREPENFDCEKGFVAIAKAALHYAGEAGAVDDVFVRMEKAHGVPRDLVLEAVDAYQRAKAAQNPARIRSIGAVLKSVAKSVMTRRARSALREQNLRTATDPNATPRARKKAQHEAIAAAEETDKALAARERDLERADKASRILESGNVPEPKAGKPRPTPDTDEGKIRAAAEGLVRHRQGTKKLESDLAALREKNARLERGEAVEIEGKTPRQIEDYRESLRAELKAASRELELRLEKQRLMEHAGTDAEPETSGRKQGPKTALESEVSDLRAGKAEMRAKAAGEIDLENRIAEAKRKIAAGDTSTTPRKTGEKSPGEIELGHLQDELRAMRERADLEAQEASGSLGEQRGRSQNVPTETQAANQGLRASRALRREVAGLDTAIAAVTDELARKELRANAKVRKPTTDHIESLRRTLTHLNAQKADLLAIDKLRTERATGQFAKRGRKLGPDTQTRTQRKAERGETTTERKIAELQDIIDTGVYATDPKKAARARTIREEVLGEKSRIVNARKKFKDLTERLEKLRAGDLSELDEPPPPRQAWHEEAERAEMHTLEIEAQMRHEIEMLKPATQLQQWWRRVETGANVWRAMRLGLDMSYVAIQAAPTLASRPVFTAKTLWSAIKNAAAFPDSRTVKGWMETGALKEHQFNKEHIESNPSHTLLMKVAKELITDRLNRREETAASALFEKLVPGYGYAARVGRMFLNKMRMELFDMMVNVWGVTGNDLKGAREIAKLVGAMTGRGLTDSKRLAGAIDAAGPVVLAPRLYLSQLEILTGQPVWGRGFKSAAQKAAVREYARTAVTLGTSIAVYGLLSDEPEWNPLSSDFLKWKDGDTRISAIPGRFLPWMNFLSRIAWGETKTADGEIKSVGKYGLKNFMPGYEEADEPGFGDAGRLQVSGDFARQRLNFIPRWIIDASSGLPFDREADWASIAVESLNPIPLVSSDLVDQMQTEFGIPHKAAISILVYLGWAAQVQGADKRERNKETREKIAEPLREAVGAITGD